MAQLYADEDFSLKVVKELRKLGHDVLTVQEAGRGGLGDPTVLADAIVLARAVVTFNRGDFHRLARLVPSHSGIITSTRDDDVISLAQRIHDAIAATGDLTNQLVRIVKPHKP